MRTMETLPRYRSPDLASAVEVLLTGSAPPPTFPSVSFELVAERIPDGAAADASGGVLIG